MKGQGKYSSASSQQGLADDVRDSEQFDKIARLGQLMHRVSEFSQQVLPYSRDIYEIKPGVSWKHDYPLHFVQLFFIW